MEQIGKSSLWVEKYRPKTIKDLILPTKYKNLLQSFIDQGEIQNLLFSGTAGCGKSTSAIVLVNDLGADLLFVNGSMETSIDTLRYKVQQFAMTSSLGDGKKIVVLDECDRLTGNAQDALKGLIELASENCRFILTTNNSSKIIDPIKSRTQIVEFNFTNNEKQEMLIGFLKRISFILSNESVKFDKKVLAAFITKKFPDFRKVINELQKFSKMQPEIDESILLSASEASFENLVNEIKSKKFNSIRKAVSSIEPDTFYNKFYLEMDKFIKDESKPDVIMILSKYAYQHGLSIDKEINLLGCVMELTGINWN